MLWVEVPGYNYIIFEIGYILKGVASIREAGEIQIVDILIDVFVFLNRRVMLLLPVFVKGPPYMILNLILLRTRIIMPPICLNQIYCCT